MESCGCIFILLLIIMIGLLCLFPIIGLFILLIILAIGFFIDKEKRLSTTIALLLGSTIFTILFVCFGACSFLFGGDSNLFVGDTRYVKINDKYTFKQIDNGEYFIDGSLQLYGIDSLAETKDYIYGRMTDSYFTLSLKDGDVKKDTIFEYLELPRECTRSTMMTSEQYLYQKSKAIKRSWQDVILWPFFLALGCAFSISFFTKKLVYWLEQKYKEWRKKRNEQQGKKDEDENENKDNGPDPILIGD